MAVTLNEVSRWLDNLDMSHNVVEEKSAIALGMVDEYDRKKGMRLNIKEDGDLFQGYANLMDEERHIVTMQDHQHSALVLQHILKLNYDEKFGAWEFDPSDGEIRFAVEVPLMDSQMTQKQFERVFGHLVNGSSSGFNEILQIMGTGELPENNSEELFDDMLNMMLLEKLKDKIEDDDEDDGI